MKKTVLSGVQPSGHLHLGNYLGSIRNWLDLQNSHNCLFGIMNLHAITVPQDAPALRQSVIDVATIYLACGLDPKKSSIFVQGDVPAHAELAWVLGCLTPLGWLNRMTQFKDKIRKKITPETIIQDYNKAQAEGEKRFEEISKIIGYKNESYAERVIDREGDNDISGDLGLYSYPVLMAADILLYHADLVPVGEDQKQHLELTRDLAGAFNRRYNTEYFKLPEPMILKDVRRIMSLQDGTKKMSKSDESEISRINLEDAPDEVVRKVKKAKTDSLSEIIYDENRPEIYNLLNIFASLSGKAPHTIADEYKTSGYGKFKGDLAEIIVEKLRPIQDNISRLRQDQDFVKDVLKNGQEKAAVIAAKTRNEVFSLVGLI